MVGPAWWGDVLDRMSAYHQANPANLPGAVFAVETRRDGRLISSVGEGWNSDTICSIASMTKPFTATGLLMALEERGQLDVEMRVCELPGMELYRKDERKRKIKVRHLLQHTSGLPSFEHYSKSPRTACNDPQGDPPGCGDDETGQPTPWTGSPGITNECIHLHGRCRPARKSSLIDVSEYVMRAYSPSFEPGTDTCYSTYSFTVAARAVETLTGESMNRYLKRKLFEPLGMKDTFFVADESGDEQTDSRIGEGVTKQQRERIAEVRLITQDGKLPPEIAPGPDGKWDRLRRGWKLVYADGGMYSTAEDLMKYLVMLRDAGESEGRRVLSEEIVRLLIEDQGFGHTMGFGYRSDTSPYGQGAGTLEHLGNLMTYMWYEPSSDTPLLGVFLSQRLPNVAVMTNMVEGLRIIYSGFILLVESGARGFKLSRPA